MAPQIVYELDGRRIVYQVERDEVRIGRDSDNDLVIRRPVVSRRHARLYREGDAWRVADLGSLNGTRVNDADCEGATVAHGDRILLHNFPLTFLDSGGPTVTLTSAHGTTRAETPQTFFQSAVDFSALAASRPQASHLQTLLTVATKASETVLSCASLDETFERVLGLVFEHFPVQRGFIMLWDDDREELVPHCVKTTDDSRGPQGEIRFSRTIADKVVRENVAVVTTDAQMDGRFADGASVFELDIHSAMAAPLWNGERVNGLIYADTLKTRAFDKFDLDLLSALGNQLALAIERWRLQDSLLRQRLARSRLERYHSPAVVERITSASDSGAGMLVADERDVTVLFADVVGFTRRCEGLEPREVAELLNRYFSEMAEVVFRHEGTLDKFIGDALMAVFGAPLPDDDHARRAADAALEMREMLELLNEPLPPEQQLQFRVGMHCGRVIAGDIGSVRRSDYTVLGSTVNLASRLESTVARAGQIVISAALREALGPRYETRFAGEQQPKGTSQPIDCFELIARVDPP